MREIEREGERDSVCVRAIETDAWRRRDFACEKVREEWGERERYVCVFRCVGEVGEREIM